MAIEGLQLGVKERMGIIKTKNIKKEGRAQAWSAENSALRRGDHSLALVLYLYLLKWALGLHSHAQRDTSRLARSYRALSAPCRLSLCFRWIARWAPNWA
ncbi:hypothetical protein HKD37_11G032413 [Glycine soja]